MPAGRQLCDEYEVVQVGSWAEFRELAEGDRFRSWAFRGHADADWPILSSLSRYLMQTRIHKKAWANQEARILRIFQGKAHIYLDHIPPEDDASQWLALMQHHGGPTRLIDLTWSPYVAAFFALERATRPAAVWAFSEVAISGTEEQTIRGGHKIIPHEMNIGEPGNYEKYYLPGDTPFVAIGKPSVMNRRLIAQAATFLVPGVLDEPVESILSDYPEPHKALAKIVLDTEAMRKEAMRSLYSMNLTYATLFPDLEGLARSMAYELEFHWAFDPETMQPYEGFPPLTELRHWSRDWGLQGNEPPPNQGRNR